MDLLDIPLPEISLALDLEPATFFDRCEAIARARGWRVDRRPAYAGPGYDQLNIHLGGGPEGYPMVRMVSTPRKPRRLDLDVVSLWSRQPIDYDEYLTTAKNAYRTLLDAVKQVHGKRYKLGVPRRPESVDVSKLDCSRISYAAEKFCGITRSLAIGRGDARDRLINAFSSFHVIRPEDLPPPLRKHLTWIYAQITRRPARHKWEGSVQATVSTMKTATAARILERLVDLADAIEALDALCKGRRGLAV